MVDPRLMHPNTVCLTDRARRSRLAPGLRPFLLPRLSSLGLGRVPDRCQRGDPGFAFLDRLCGLACGVAVEVRLAPAPSESESIRSTETPARPEELVRLAPPPGHGRRPCRLLLAVHVLRALVPGALRKSTGCLLVLAGRMGLDVRFDWRLPPPRSIRARDRGAGGASAQRCGALAGPVPGRCPGHHTGLLRPAGGPAGPP